jgi:hypothetical protein
MACASHRRCSVLPTALGLRLADAAPGVSPLANCLYHFRKWRLDGDRLRQVHERLRAAVRQAEGRTPDPSGAVIASQAVKGSGVGGPERGYDGAKRLSGRKRHLLVDTEGFVLKAQVHSAKFRTAVHSSFCVLRKASSTSSRYRVICSSLYPEVQSMVLSQRVARLIHDTRGDGSLVGLAAYQRSRWGEGGHPSP